MVALRQKRILAYDQHSDILRGKHRSATASGSDLPRTTPVCPTELQLQARLAHLATIQGVIGRMAGYSASVKTFTLTVSAALVAVAFDKELPVLFYAGFLIAAVFALLDDMSVHDDIARLWAQTEQIKAGVLAARLTGDARWWTTAANGAEALLKYFDVPVKGLWRDKLQADGTFVDEAAPASSFYHIVCAILELDRAVEAQA